MTSYLAGDPMSPQLVIAAGSACGLAIGTVATSFVDWAGPVERSRAPADRSGSTVASALPVVEWWFPSVVVAPLGDAEGLAPVQGSQVLLTVSGAFR